MEAVRNEVEREVPADMSVAERQWHRNQAQRIFSSLEALDAELAALRFQEEESRAFASGFEHRDGSSEVEQIAAVEASIERESPVKCMRLLITASPFDRC